MKVFLGGTLNSNWRSVLVPLLKIEYFNPVVKDWTPECQAEELKQREICDLCLYVITPKMTGVYSIAEAVDDSNKRASKTIFVVLEKDGLFALFSSDQIKSLNAVSNLITKNGGTCFKSLVDTSNYLNTKI